MDRCVAISTNFNFACENTLEEKTGMSRYFTVVVLKHIKSAS